MRTTLAILTLLCALSVRTEKDKNNNAIHHNHHHNRRKQVDDGNATSVPSSGCPPPNLSQNGSELDTNQNFAVRLRSDYSRVREVKFSGSIGPMGERRLCKIKCIEGQWVGPLCIDQHDGGRFHPLLRSCRLKDINPHLVVTFRNISITNNHNWAFPHGAIVQVRCRELGLYKLLGDSSPKCQNGAWSSKLPSCIPTTMITNFTEDAPPTILIRIPAGSASVEPNGALAVFPGSTVHLECLFSRRLGTPEWTWTPIQGQYLTGWAIAAEEKDWKYRLSVYYTKPQDSGTFTCATPKGITNSISLQITAVHCEELEVTDQYLSVRLEGTRLGQSAVFQCPTGFRINGTANLTCQASGKWSGSIPKCEPVRCPALDILSEPHLRLEEHNASYGGRAVFRCAWGYRLSGPPGIECELNGTWSGPMPKCVAIQCPAPSVPKHGHLMDSGVIDTIDGTRYAVGSLVQFACDASYLLVGEANIVCTETGYWSHPPPFCKARCPYPGEPANGIIAPVKFFYEPGDLLQVTCNPGFESRLEARPKCRQNGTWSEPLPECTSYDKI